MKEKKFEGLGGRRRSEGPETETQSQICTCGQCKERESRKAVMARR